MKQSRLIAIVFSAVNLILIIICGVFYFRADRTKPEFRFQVSDLIYREETGQEQLLENITASDREDGDVTERIVIEKIVRSEQENSVIVFYAVSDKAGNVAKISRAFPAQIQKKDAPEDAGAQLAEGSVPGAADAMADGKDGTVPGAAAGAMTGGTDDPAFGAAGGADGATGKIPDGAAAGGGSAVGTAGEAGAAAEGENGERTARNKDAGADEDGDRTEKDREAKVGDAREEDRTSPEAQPAEPQASSDTDRGKAPVLTLKTGEVTTIAGTAPAWVDVIGSLSDDKDSYETLFYNLSISKYDVNKAGTYKVALTTKDSDGNKSDPVTLTIHVK